ncbi:MAG: cation:proton antiporter [Acidimicrobiia bacterium]
MDESALFLVELGAVILGLGVMARLAGRLGISPIPLYLIAGLALGEGGLIPVITSDDFIGFGAELGVIFLLLMLGLEYSARELVQGVRSVATAGLVDFVLNFTPGFLTGLILGLDPVPSVFFGGVTYVSSTGIVAKLLDDLGWSGNRETPVVLSILVFEDLAMAVLLPILGVLALGATVASAALTVGLAVAVIVVIIALVARGGDRLGSLVFHHSDEVSLLSLFGLTLLVGGLAEGVNVSAAVGAFLVGIGVSGDSVSRARSLLTPLRDLFAAVFFVFFGLQTDPGDIPDVALAAITVAIITGLTKFAVGWWAARRVGIGRQGRLRAGSLLVARAEFSIVIAGLAASLAGSERLAALAATYVLIMAIAGPIAAKIADARRPHVILA